MWRYWGVHYAASMSHEDIEASIGSLSDDMDECLQMLRHLVGPERRNLIRRRNRICYETVPVPIPNVAADEAMADIAIAAFQERRGPISECLERGSAVRSKDRIENKHAMMHALNAVFQNIMELPSDPEEEAEG